MSGVWVAVGGILGAWARFALGKKILDRWSGAFPWVTFGINGSGALALGFTTAWGLPEELGLLVEAGFLASYTTFSTLSYELLVLLEGGEWRKAAWYFGISGFLGLALALLGYGLGGWLSGLGG